VISLGFSKINISSVNNSVDPTDTSHFLVRENTHRDVNDSLAKKNPSEKINVENSGSGETSL